MSQLRIREAGLLIVPGSRRHGSGDYALAFSTQTWPADLRSVELDLVFSAVMDAVEEAVPDALLAATSVLTSSGRRADALPHSAVLKALA